MTAHPVGTPYVLKTLTAQFKLVGGVTVDDFSDHIDTLELVPTATTASWTGANGNTVQRNATATWSINLGMVQDLDQDGLLRWLFTNEGRQAYLLATFEDGTDPMLAAVTLAPAGFGGKADGSIPVATVQLPASGKPTWSASAAFPA